MRLPHSIIVLIIAMGMLTACGSSRKASTTQYIYFQNGRDTIITPQKKTVIQANDLLGIQIYSRTLNQEQAAIFNIPATTGNDNNGQAVQQPGYQVNTDGNIEMPVIGAVKAAGLTRDQLQASLVQKLTEYVKNPTVLIRFLQFNINVLGEVKNPGTQKFIVDKVTIIDAISAAGDLTDFGKREDITVIREESGKKISYRVDLSNKNLFQSPVYILQPNDIVYVGPNKNKLRNLSYNPDKQRRTGLFFEIVSILISTASIIVFATR